MKRSKQIEKAVGWLDRAGALIHVYITPRRAHFWIYREELPILDAIHGKENVIQIVEED